MSYINKTVQVRNIFHMLAYNFDNLYESGYSDMGSEDFSNTQDLYAEIIVTGTRCQLKHGLYREYSPKRDDLLTKRGTIDVAGTIRNRLKNSRHIHCNYDEFTDNNMFNQILKTTIILLSRSDEVEKGRRETLKRVLTHLSHIDSIEPSAIQWTSIQFRQNSGNYQMLLTVCHLALDELLVTEQGKDHMKRIDVEETMAKLYERFILKYYRKHYPSLKVEAKQVKWDLDKHVQNMPIMQTDVTIERDGCTLIIDAKLYSRTLIRKKGYDKQTFISSNLYQIYTYVNNYRQTTGNKVSGALLYARTDEEIVPDDSFKLTNDDYSIKTLDLNQVFEEISQQLDDLVNRHFDGVAKNQ